MIAPNLVTTTEGLSAALGHANVVQLALTLEPRESSDRYLYGNVGIDASALEQI